MLKIGHRGASGNLPENTLAAFAGALAQGADGVELDVHRCKSGELVVIHDDTVDRTTDGSGQVADMTLAQIRALRVGKTEHIPTLDEALLLLEGAYCFIEAKHDDAVLAVAETIKRHVKRGHKKSRLWLISFHHEALKAAPVVFPAINIGASFQKIGPTSLRDAHHWGARTIIPNYALLEAAHVEAAHRLSLQVICWTVNEAADIARMQSLKVDGIISDYPERLVRPHG